MAVTDRVCDVCVVGSGAGGAPLACALAQRGLDVVMLERGPQYDAAEFEVDELWMCRRDAFVPSPDDGLREVIYGDEPAVQESHLWSGSCVGGGTVRMSGFFLRMRREDFVPVSTYGSVAGATATDWPIGLADLEPYYQQVEEDVGVSGDAAQMPVPRERPFPLPALPAHPSAGLLDKGCEALGYHAFPTPRAVLSEPYRGREACGHNGFCGGYGCAAQAKGGAHVTYVPQGLRTGNLELRTGTKVCRIDSTGDKATGVRYVTASGEAGTVRADTFVVACSAIESARLLLNSATTRHPAGLANSSCQVGRNLAFQMPCEVLGRFEATALPSDHLELTPHVQRTTESLRDLGDQSPGYRRGGAIVFMLAHPNPIHRAVALSYDRRGGRVFGQALKRRLHDYYRYVHLASDTFLDYLPNEFSRVSVSRSIRDNDGIPVARVVVRPHPTALQAANVMATRIGALYRAMGAVGAEFNTSPFTAGECQQGTCRFGTDPGSSVLDPFCRTHDVRNLYITDGSFIPSGLVVPPAFTIMANSLRVADHILTS